MLFEIIFWLANLYTMPFWLLMIFAPHWSWTPRICGSLLIFLPLALAYTMLLIPTAGSLTGTSTTIVLDLSSAEAITAMLRNVPGVIVGWIHFLAFDLFVGRWAYLDSRERKLPALWVSPTLVFVYLTGPFGLLLYLIVRYRFDSNRGAAKLAVSH